MNRDREAPVFRAILHVPSDAGKHLGNSHIVLVDVGKL